MASLAVCLGLHNQKHNYANEHGNTDGTHDYSWNCGVEGDQDLSDGILELRKQQVKNLFCLLMLSGGTPMFRMVMSFCKRKAETTTRTTRTTPRRGSIGSD